MRCFPSRRTGKRGAPDAPAKGLSQATTAADSEVHEVGMASVVPFHRPCITGQELAYVARVIAKGELGEGGEFDHKCSDLIEKRCGTRKVYLTPSCTAALEMAAILCEIGAGDEILLPSFTFPSTANAFVKLGAHPVFVDVRPDTLNLDEARV